MGNIMRIAKTAACLALLVPATGVSAQMGWLKRSQNLQLDVNGGVGNYGRFLLQSPISDINDFRQRELRGGTLFTVGAGIGATVLPRVGTRLSFNYSEADLNWRDDTGTGSELLDLDDVGSIQHWVIGAEIIRYLLPERSRFSPYASAGFLATWWDLEDDAITIEGVGGNSQFRWGGVGLIGLQYAASPSLRVRLEANVASIGNPFTGNESWVAIVGHPIDEPGRVRKTDLRLALAWVFARRDADETTNGNGNGRRR